MHLPLFFRKLIFRLNYQLMTGFFLPRPRGGPVKKPKRWLPPLLLILTIASTFIAGIGMFGSLQQGFLFSLILMVILGAHESGHYFTARYHGVPASLPYFIPFPNIIGTMGAVMRMRGAVHSRRALFDIGIAGPLAGWIPALISLLAGYARASVLPLMSPPDGASITFGSSLLMKGIEMMLYGRTDVVVQLNPFLYAGWVGMLVTALNLMPAGQLDGGHIIYAMFPDKQKDFGMLVFMMLIAASFFWPGWIVWVVLMFIFGVRHPPVADYTELDPKRRRLGYLAMVIFVISFMPVPISIK